MMQIHQYKNYCFSEIYLSLVEIFIGEIKFGSVFCRGDIGL